MIIIFSLSIIVKTIKSLVEDNKNNIINRVLTKNAYATLLFGIGITIAVQSSSITTSLLIPMASSGLLSLDAIYPITIGANIDTIATALLASLTGNMADLTIALVHLIFNLFGTLIFFPSKTMRQIPIKCAEFVSESIDKTKFIGFGYAATVFFLLPASMIYIFR